MKINSGAKIDEISVTISHKIIELFSAGLYSSPNKAFEELVCNSYDAYADKVGVYLTSDLNANNAFIWVCDNGESMDQEELKNLWKIGESSKREKVEKDSSRLQIGRFGIGKLATYVLANELTYICKKGDRYLATQMDYTRINKGNDSLILDEIELSEDEARELVLKYVKINGKSRVPFRLFGENSENSWTVSILTNLKAKASEIREGRLKWILKTALPMNPNFKLFYNGVLLESSKINKPLLRSWIIGKDDDTVSKIESCNAYEEDGEYYIDFPNLKRVHGKFDLYEDSLLDGKSSDQGRSHGIFLMVRGRLINLDDPLLGMEAFSHGAFNKSWILIHADDLDNNIASTRESIKESTPYNQLKEYIKKKFNNEVRKYYFDLELKKQTESSLAYRISQTSGSFSKAPILNFVKRYFEQKIVNSWLIEKPEIKKDEHDLFINKLEETLEEDNLINGDPSWEILQNSDPIAKFDIVNRVLRINLMHPFIANFSEVIKSNLPIEFIATTEVLTEAHLYELDLDEEIINSIMRRRDRILRELALSDRLSAPVVAELVKDALADSTGLEDAVYKSFLTLGFETTKIGGNGKPDGKAEAILGYSDSNKCENFSLTYDAKSTGKKKIQAGTAKLSSINRHKEDYKANFAVVVAIDYEGSDNPESAISVEAKQQKITVMKAKDLMRLILLAVPKQIGLKELKDLFENCYTPLEVKGWVDRIEEKELDKEPIKTLLEVIYDLQKTDSEPPELASVRIKLNSIESKKYSKSDIKELASSLSILVPGFINIEGEKISLNNKPHIILNAIESATNNVPIDFQKLYINALSIQ